MSANKVLSIITNMNHRYLFIILISISIFFAAIPVAFPVRPAPNTQDYFNFIDNMKPGDVFVFDCSANIQSRAVEEQKDLPLLTHLFAKPGIKFIGVSFSAPGPVNWELVLSLVPERYKSLKTYGVDYVYLGYIPGDEVGIGAFTSNIRSVKSVDYYNNPIDSLSLMTTGNPKTGGPINDASAFYGTRFNLWNAAMLMSYARIFGDAWNVPIIIVSSSWATDSAYYPKYIQHYLLSGQEVEYESLITSKYDYIGVNMQYYSEQATASALFVTLIVAANIAAFATKSKKRSEVIAK